MCRGRSNTRVSSDVIAGYPDESEEDHRATLELLKRMRPDFLNITRFSPRPGTEANELSLLPGSLVKERSRRITKLHHSIRELKLRSRINDVVEDALVIESRGGDFFNLHFFNLI